MFQGASTGSKFFEGTTVGMTGLDWLPGYVPRFDRQYECETWMNAHRDRGTPWVAIDDRGHWFEPECRHLLLTESRKGFQAEHQALLRQMLQERL